MNIVCVICSDLLDPSTIVVVTPCGHIFHYKCLTQWLDISKTCPQCREKTTKHKIHKIYFNFSNSDPIIEDASSLKITIDKLKSELNKKEKTVENYINQTETLNAQNKLFKKEVENIESVLHQKEIVIYTLIDRVQLLKKQNLKIHNRTKENVEFRINIENFIYWIYTFLNKYSTF